jgi:LDH2 family malate/lactate/ureidoglycolate dehydrogenase
MDLHGLHHWGRRDAPAAVYVERLRGGVMTAVTKSERVVDSGAVVVLDGHHGIGQVLTAEAVGDIFFPGELEDRNAHRNRSRGITVADKTWGSLTRLAAETGTTLPDLYTQPLLERLT